MAKKTKPSQKKQKPKKEVRLSKRVVIGNGAVNENNLVEAMSFLNPKSKKPKGYKFVGLDCAVYAGAVVLSWACKGIGFGEVTFYLQEGKLSLDSEGMSKEFVTALMKEVVKQEKKGQLKIKVQAPLARVLDRLWTELGNQDLNLEKRKK
jgi:hypothetical protein